MVNISSANEKASWRGWLAPVLAAPGGWAEENIFSWSQKAEEKKLATGDWLMFYLKKLRPLYPQPVGSSWPSPCEEDDWLIIETVEETLVEAAFWSYLKATIWRAIPVIWFFWKRNWRSCGLKIEEEKQLSKKLSMKSYLQPESSENGSDTEAWLTMKISISSKRS